MDKTKIKSETNDLLIKYKATKNEELRNKIVMLNLPLIKALTKRFFQKGFDFNDLLQEATLGFMKAIDYLDLSKGVQLSTYSYFWIRCYIFNYIHENIRIVRESRGSYRKAFKHRALKADGVSIDTRGFIEGGEWLRSEDNPEENVARSLDVEKTKQYIESVNGKLTAGQLIAVDALFYDKSEPSYKEVGKQIGVTRQSVQQNLKTALNHYKEVLQEVY